MSATAIVAAPEEVAATENGAFSTAKSSIHAENDGPTRTVTYRKDYKPPSFAIEHVDLYFVLDDNTTVRGTLCIRPSRKVEGKHDLVLNGEDLTCKSVSINGKKLTEGCGYTLTSEQTMIIPYAFLPEDTNVVFTVETEVSFSPQQNLQLMGLYKSGKIYCTQCEAMGFRRITYFLDRPDVMTSFTVHIEADKKACPVMLCNGNHVSTVPLSGDPDRHVAKFDDPYAKPCYLFALVAGDLHKLTDTFQTMSGKSVTLNLFSDSADSDKLTWALECLRMAMKWDEEKFGREYDLEVFNIVCIRDFNMGAMENKGLNIFNASCLLASEETSTDKEFQRVASVVSHEYFHNWTGNRVTCRDWFQITLKEGLTVFREQLFYQDTYSSVVKRIEDVIMLRNHQFPEDSSPLSHPIRPESYVAMDNFYTVTVYEKGAEVIRMYHTLLGKDGFRKGMDLYFERHDGYAVTCDDFRLAMGDACNRDLSQFELWYSQAGTPIVEVVQTEYKKDQKTFSVTLRQHVSSNIPFIIPIQIGLIGRDSKSDLLNPTSQILELTEFTQSFSFTTLEEPLISLLRNFSAPVKLKFEQNDEDLALLLSHDSDGFNRWEAGQKLASKILLERAEKLRGADKDDVKKLEPAPSLFISAFRNCLLANMEDKSAQALVLRLPSIATLKEDMHPIDPHALYLAETSLRKELLEHLEKDMRKVYDELTMPDDYVETLDEKDMSRRRLRNTLLGYLTARADDDAGILAFEHFKKGKNMTDRLAALSCLVNVDGEERELALEEFYLQSRGDPRVVDTWFSVQASANREDAVECVLQLLEHKDFDFVQPNRLRSLVSVFTWQIAFHRIDGAGYRLIADCVIKVDKFNPQIASRLCRNLMNYRKYEDTRKNLMKLQLERIAAVDVLSDDVHEIISKTLNE
ncbi:putative aminopeptidase n [Cardiosporidium cionae]|uniref:Aminopeptidase n n=1 Tax=Cardiosporidium cionae TaxID=476202 RepID=A0ABQ7JF49_9APIC|nr:putative aminopeptidase n [Cardiosporidium cionae]|eukprot:KAF8822637.1 putative aminopeptidase n [Cardiosporidium cionae]